MSFETMITINYGNILGTQAWESWTRLAQKMLKGLNMEFFTKLRDIYWKQMLCWRPVIRSLKGDAWISAGHMSPALQSQVSIIDKRCRTRDENSSV